MNTSRITTLLVAALCGLSVMIGLVLSRNVTAQGEPLQPLRVAVVNQTEALKKCKILDRLNNDTTTFIEKDWQEKIEALRKDLDEKTAYLEDRRKDDTTSARELDRIKAEIEVAKEKVKLAREARDAAEKAMRFMNMLKTLAAFNIAIRRVAVRDDLDLVFKWIDLRAAAKEGPDGASSVAAAQAFRQSANENMIVFFKGASEGRRGRVIDITARVNEELRSMEYDDEKENIDREIGFE